MKMFTLPFDKLILRFYLLMAVVIVPFFMGVPILALLALPVFLSALLGVEFTSGPMSKVRRMKKKEYPNVFPEEDFTRAA